MGTKAELAAMKTGADTLDDLGAQMKTTLGQLRGDVDALRSEVDAVAAPAPPAADAGDVRTAQALPAPEAAPAQAPAPEMTEAVASPAPTERAP